MPRYTHNVIHQWLLRNQCTNTDFRVYTKGDHRDIHLEYQECGRLITFHKNGMYTVYSPQKMDYLEKRHVQCVYTGHSPVAFKKEQGTWFIFRKQDENSTQYNCLVASAPLPGVGVLVDARGYARHPFTPYPPLPPTQSNFLHFDSNPPATNPVIA